MGLENRLGIGIAGIPRENGHRIPEFAIDQRGHFPEITQ
jgi:hypothetical protein